MEILPNYSIEHVVLPSIIPDLPPRGMVIVRQTFEPMTEEALYYQQKIREEIAIQGVIYGTGKGS